MSSPNKALALALLALASGGAAAAPCPGEEARAQATRQRIVQEWPLRPLADEAAVFVQELAARLARRYGAGAEAVRWRFALARDLAPNAFSIGAGSVFITEGAFTFAQNEEELAAIVAHEMGHELAGHFCDYPSPEPGAGFGDFLFGAPPPPPEPHSSAELGSLRQTVDLNKEQQADRLAVGVLQAAGYDPRALLRVAGRLPSAGEGHWADRRRVQALEQFLAALPPGKAADNPKDSEPFQAIKRRLLAEIPH